MPIKQWAQIYRATIRVTRAFSENVEFLKENVGKIVKEGTKFSKIFSENSCNRIQFIGFLL